jgi:hypothetical protein
MSSWVFARDVLDAIAMASDERNARAALMQQVD